MGSSPLTPEQARNILRETIGQDRVIFSIYAYTLAKARTLRIDDMRMDGKGRFWLRLAHKNRTETWQEIPAWLRFLIIERPLSGPDLA